MIYENKVKDGGDWKVVRGKEQRKLARSISRRPVLAGPVGCITYIIIFLTSYASEKAGFICLVWKSLLLLSFIPKYFSGSPDTR